MKKQQHITAFYLETLLLIIVFIGIILVLSRVYGIGQKQSSEAAHLTEAVTLAANAAEAVSASSSGEELEQLLDENGNTEKNGNEILAGYDESMKPVADGAFLVSVTWEPDEEDPTFVNSRITVFYEQQSSPVYTLETAVWLGGPLVAPSEGVGR